MLPAYARNDTMTHKTKADIAHQILANQQSPWSRDSGLYGIAHAGLVRLSWDALRSLLQMSEWMAEPKP